MQRKTFTGRDNIITGFFSSINDEITEKMRKIISTKKKLRISLLKTPEDKTLKSFESETWYTR